MGVFIAIRLTKVCFITIILTNACFHYYLHHQSVFSQPYDSQTRVFTAICLIQACFHTHFTLKLVFLLPAASNELVFITICLITACFHYHMLHESVREIMFRYMATARDISRLKTFRPPLGPAQPPIRPLYGTLSLRE